MDTPHHEPAFDLACFPDDALDIAISEPRFDVAPCPSAAAEQPTRGAVGPRQRRFTFDAPVIRDTIVRKLRSIERDDIARPLDNCHREAHYRKCVGCGDVRTFFNRCERFYCPICAGRLARDRRETVAFWQKEVAQPKHIVLTVQSVSTLTKAWIRKLKHDFRKLRAMKWAREGEFLWRATAVTPSQPRPEPIDGIKRRNRKQSVWIGRKLGNKTTKWRGGFWSLDATWHADVQPGQKFERDGRDLIADEPVRRGWHIHFHIIVDADFVDRAKLEAEWSKLRGQSMSVVRVYDVRGKDYTAEACKYVCDGVQVGSWPAEKLAEFADALSEERCFDTFGLLYKRRAEWSATKKLIQSDKNVCACGCGQFAHFDENEWEWHCAKTGTAPPGADKVHRARVHPEFALVMPTVYH